MASGASGTDKDQLNRYNSEEDSTLGAYNSDIGSYMSNVNAALRAGNPYQSKQYLQNQNLETSGAMNAENTREGQQLRDAARRSGTNTAAIAGTIADSARKGQRDLTQYNAGRDTANEDKWLQERQNLLRDQGSGADSESRVFGSEVGGSSNALSNYTTAKDAEDEMWAQLGSAALTGAGTGAGLAMH